MIDWCYGIIDLILPFRWAGHDFMKNAFLALLLLAPLYGILGTMIVSNRMAFFSDSLGHGAFTGIAIGTLLGSLSPIWAAIVFSVIFAIAVTLIKNKSKTSTDTIIGVFSSTAIALGLVILSYGGSFARFSAYLVGDLLSVSPGEIAALFFVLIAILIIWLILFDKILLISVNRQLAASRGIRAMAVEMVFTSIIAIVVTLTIQWIGLLLINSLMVLPAAAARNVTSNMRQYHLVSVAIAAVSSMSGLILSYYCNTATGATIVLVAALIFFATFIFRTRFQG